MWNPNISTFKNPLPENRAKAPIQSAKWDNSMSSSFYSPSSAGEFDGRDFVHLGQQARSETTTYPNVSSRYLGTNPIPNFKPWEMGNSNSAFSGDKSQAYLDRQLEELSERNKPVTWEIDRGKLNKFNKKGGRKSRKSRKTRKSRRSRRSRK